MKYGKWIIGTELNIDLVEFILIRIFHINTIHVGDFLQDETGEWLFWFVREEGVWEAYTIREILKGLDYLNEYGRKIK